MRGCPLVGGSIIGGSTVSLGVLCTLVDIPAPAVPEAGGTE